MDVFRVVLGSGGKELSVINNWMVTDNYLYLLILIYYWWRLSFLLAQRRPSSAYANFLRSTPFSISAVTTTTTLARRLAWRRLFRSWRRLCRIEADFSFSRPFRAVRVFLTILPFWAQSRRLLAVWRLFRALRLLFAKLSNASFHSSAAAFSHLTATFSGSEQTFFEL